MLRNKSLVNNFDLVEDISDTASEVLRGGTQRTYDNPVTKSGERLDYCLKWGQNCGSEAAQAYCRTQGYNIAVEYGIETNLLQTEGLDGWVCNAGDNFADCDGFDFIVCGT